MAVYRPRPVITSDDALPPSMELLAEVLAEDAHERWAQLQIENGWSFGPERDHFSKRDPDIVHYDKLPQLTKDHILRASQANIKTLLALGYRVMPPHRAG